MATILGYGSYVPRYRIERSEIAGQYGEYARGGETAVPGHDEDTTTMAVEAASAALDHADAAAGDLDAVFAATTSDPFDERGVAPHVAYALGAPEHARVGDFQGSARAATNALLSAADAVAANGSTVLVVASDALSADAGSSAEQTAGAGAGAVLLGGGDGAARIVGDAAATTGYVGRFVPAGGSPREGDGRFNRGEYLRAVTGAVSALDAESFDRAAFPAADGRWGGKAAGALELDADLASTFDSVGYAGAGGVLLDLAAMLDTASAGEHLLLAGYGPGGCDALAFERVNDSTPAETTDELLARGEHVPYGKHRRFREQGGVA